MTDSREGLFLIRLLGFNSFPKFSILSVEPKSKKQTQSQEKVTKEPEEILNMFSRTLETQQTKTGLCGALAQQSICSKTLFRL